MKPKTVCTFHTRDNAYTNRNGQSCTILRALTDTEANLTEVGPMYKVQFADGFIADAFEDELSWYKCDDTPAIDPKDIN